MSEFTLTSEIIKNGLSDAVMSEYSGIPVHSHLLGEFPHGEKVVAAVRLNEWELHERAQAILIAQNAMLDDTDGTFMFNIEDALLAAQMTNPAVIAPAAPTDFNFPEAHSHFQTLQAEGIDGSIEKLLHHRNERSDLFRNYVYTGSLNEPLPVANTYKSDTAFVFRHAPSTSDRHLWSEVTYMPQSLIVQMPNDGFLRLLQDLHEMRHLVQMTIDVHPPLVEYYKELDADLFARSMLRQAGVAEETLLGHMEARYIHLLIGPVTHHIAPALEAFEKSQEPPSFYQTFDAVMTLKRDLLFSLYDTEPRTHSINDAQAAENIYRKHPRNDIWYSDQNPFDKIAEQIYKPKLKRALGVLEEIGSTEGYQSPLAQKIAKRIVKAGRYFGGDNLVIKSALRPAPKSALPDNGPFIS